MGFQNMNDESGETYNREQCKKSNRRTSKTNELSNTTTKCQYERLSKTGKGGGE